MIDSLTPHLSTVTADVPIAGGEGGEAGGSAIFMLLMFGLLAVFIFATWRRSRKMREDVRKANEGAVVGAEVVTAGGIVGHVVSRDDERQRITLEFSNGDRIDFLLQAVQQIVEPASGQVSETDMMDQDQSDTDPTAPDNTDPR
ncbi:preprotein translocase subunit YajC [Nesterenkonia natronophila]|uniref:Preprotein translocase subunit YajC n=1 Tax=Nesterenkonia natronophila TaxID=2174932 RepID=A0A3A4F8S4_9MICC|nr:preprotein translocase subunit YajC [Nesterenkonia natronophila]RJN31284.1 preprotein translocase subunit YajC [Nesterenkonia natronophila]